MDCRDHNVFEVAFWVLVFNKFHARDVKLLFYKGYISPNTYPKFDSRQLIFILANEGLLPPAAYHVI